MTDRQTENAADIDKDIRRRHNWPENWQLHIVDDIEHTQDKSGLYVYINWDLQTESVRLDVMSVPTSAPIVSFRGKSENVCKATMRFLQERLRGRLTNVL
jgi:hypothetical protein